MNLPWSQVLTICHSIRREIYRELALKFYPLILNFEGHHAIRRCGVDQLQEEQVPDNVGLRARICYVIFSQVLSLWPTP